MYQDPEVAQLIRRLDERKRAAVREERYDYAKKLKQAIADLQKVRPAHVGPRAAGTRTVGHGAGGPSRAAARAAGGRAAGAL